MRAITGMTALAATFIAMQPALAQTVRDATFAFTVDFPGNAERIEMDGDLPDWVVRATGWDQTDDAYMTVMVIQTLPDNYTYNDLPGALQGARGECVTGDRIIDERAFPVSGGLGGEVLTSRQEFSGVYHDLVRFAAKGNRIYCARASYGEDDDPAQARAFINSFRVL